uniref:L1 transposable element RRM domain-containing protein n=1 Tax=Cyprinus carpio TaxID=7962 RepID=A0A8C1LBN4_CYPCA
MSIKPPKLLRESLRKWLPRESPLKGKVQRGFSIKNEALRNKMEYIENYNRRNNIRLIGLSEGAEEENFGAPIIIERAHHVPTVRIPGKAPRPILIRLLRFQDRETILRIAREKAPIYVDGKRVSFFPDFSSEVMNRRRGMIPALKALKEKNVNCHLVYPARIRILTEDGGTRFCHTSDELQNRYSTLQEDT